MEFSNFDIDWEYLLERIERFLDLGEEYLTRKLADYQTEPLLFRQNLAFRWVKSYQTGYFEEVPSPDLPEHADFVDMDIPLEHLCRNTAQFVNDFPANHILILGQPGNGKRSAIKGLLTKFGNQGLRLIEIRREDLHQLSRIVSELKAHPFHFILLCSDITEDMTDANHRELRNLLQGGIETRARNVLLYATGNSKKTGPPKTANEQGNLESCFGITLQIPAMNQTTYLKICGEIAKRRNLSLPAETLQRSALTWAKQRGYCSGIMACQFMDDLTGRWLLKQKLSDCSS
jgi:predicted AAA+ superfamily ATPase